MTEQIKTISREELHQQLWKVPISRLSVKLGYSSVELVKICTELNIPRPSGGYWYRLQHGGATEQVALPPVPEGATNFIFSRGIRSGPIFAISGGLRLQTIFCDYTSSIVVGFKVVGAETVIGHLVE
jgi:hypothetical protein